MSDGSRRNEDAAYTELGADAWHENEDGGYYTDCPACGSPATLMNVAKHGRCNASLGQVSAHDSKEAQGDCTAKLWLELGHVSDSDAAVTESDVEQSPDAVATGDGVPGEGAPPGTDETVDEDQ
ncbi:hypothetical protein OB905_08135 [Halobacteria archaeon AArc-dxtr1]|nr:hypothetical protein [Halobacteria archaeon AArc-dxtr1]